MFDFYEWYQEANAYVNRLIQDPGMVLFGGYSNLSPQELDNASHLPIVGPIFDWEYQKLMSIEGQKRDQDRQRNTGQSWKNSPYPYTSYRKNSYEGMVRGGSVGDLFEVTEGIMSLYGGKFGRMLKR